MRRNKVTITLVSKTGVDEERLAEMGGDGVALDLQYEGIEEMLGDYDVFDDFNVTIDATIEEE